MTLLPMISTAETAPIPASRGRLVSMEGVGREARIEDERTRFGSRTRERDSGRGRPVGYGHDYENDGRGRAHRGRAPIVASSPSGNETAPDLVLGTSSSWIVLVVVAVPDSTSSTNPSSTDPSSTNSSSTNSSSTGSAAERGGEEASRVSAASHPVQNRSRARPVPAGARSARIPGRSMLRNFKSMGGPRGGDWMARRLLEYP